MSQRSGSRSAGSKPAARQAGGARNKAGANRGRGGPAAKGKGKRPNRRPAQTNRVAPVLWTVAVLAAILLIAAVVINRDNSGPAAKNEIAPVEVSGQALPEFVAGGADPAVGQQAPELRGQGFDGEARSITNDGRPKLLMFLAHWCPHCQAEVPRIVDWLADEGKPEGIDLYSVSTSVSARQPNYPPSAWLAREGWTVPVMADDEGGSAARAFGLSGFPYFVFVDAQGRVVQRASGELSIDAIKQGIARATQAAAPQQPQQ